MSGSSGMPRTCCSFAPFAAGRGPGTEPEDESAAADALHTRRRGGKHSGMTICNVGHERAEADRVRRGGEGAEQREAFEHRPVALDRGAVEVVEHPGGVIPLGFGTHDGVAKKRPVIGAGAVLNVDLHCCSRESHRSRVSRKRAKSGTRRCRRRDSNSHLQRPKRCASAIGLRRLLPAPRLRLRVAIRQSIRRFGDELFERSPSIWSSSGRAANVEPFGQSADRTSSLTGRREI